MRVFNIVLRVFLIELASFAWLHSTCLATTPTTAPFASAADVDQLIKQMGNDVPEEREAAQKKLEEIGSSASGKLRIAAESDLDPEIRSRAAAVLAQMDTKERFFASLITLHMKDAPLKDVLNAIGDQSHTRFKGDDQICTIDADQKPFWEVITDLCQQQNASPVFEQDGTIRLFRQTRGWILRAPHEIVGPFWVGVTGIYHDASVDLVGNHSIDQQFYARYLVFPEPKLSMKQILDFHVTEAKDDAGHSLKPHIHFSGARGQTASQRGSFAIDSRLDYPENAGKKIAVLRGDITLLTAPDIQHYQVDDVMGTPTVSNPIQDCKIDAAVTRQGNNMFRVTIKGDRAALSADQWTMSDIELQDVDGQTMPMVEEVRPAHPGYNYADPKTFLISQLFAAIQIRSNTASQPIIPVRDPKRLIWNVPLTFRVVSVPVTIKDLPLP